MDRVAGGTPAPDDFLAELARWSAAEKVGRSVAERSRTRSLQDQAAATATWEGILVDLAEAACEVAVSVRWGRKVTGRLVGTARDFVVIESRRGAPVMVRTAAISAISPSTAVASAAGPSAVAVSGRPGGRRRPPIDLDLAGALDALAAERAPLVVWVGAESFTGWVASCGEDFLTVRAEGAGQRPLYLPMESVVCVELR